MYIFNDCRLHNNSDAKLVTGYQYNGERIVTKRKDVLGSTSGTIYHNIRVVIDNSSLRSTKVFLDNRMIGSFQEHFVARLKGGVFVLREFKSVALFQNFVIQSCHHFDESGNCTEIDGNKQRPALLIQLLSILV